MLMAGHFRDHKVYNIKEKMEESASVRIASSNIYKQP